MFQNEPTPDHKSAISCGAFHGIESNFLKIVTGDYTIGFLSVCLEFISNSVRSLQFAHR